LASPSGRIVNTFPLGQLGKQRDYRSFKQFPMLATLTHKDLELDSPVPTASALPESAAILFPPIMDVCRAQAVPSTCEYPVCLVADDIFCGYRLSHRNLGHYCLHPLHAKIVERTSAAKAGGPGVC